MSRPLSLVRLRPDFRAISKWAIPNGYLTDRDEPDLGYALHAAMKAALGEYAPTPFVLRQSSTSALELLGYIEASSTDVIAASTLPSLNDAPAALALNVSTIEAKSMPESWHENSEWSFETRVRPIVRSRKSQNGEASGRRHEHEVDYAAWVSGITSTSNGEEVSKEAAYLDWLTQEFGRNNAAELVKASLVSLKRTRVLRRTQGGRRVPKLVDGPDIQIRGQIRVADSAQFPSILRRGLGRHRSFGFGCVLLAPPGVFR